MFDRYLNLVGKTIIFGLNIDVLLWITKIENMLDVELN